MSSTNRGAKRKPLDQYYTPDELARACVNRLIADDWFFNDPRTVLEPSVGAGAWVRAARAALPEAGIWGVDIDPNVYGVRLCDGFLAQDFLTFQGPTVGPADGFDLILGNPPFNQAEAHVRHALSLVHRFGIVAFILRSAFKESIERLPFWTDFPHLIDYTLVPRPSFTGGTSDSCAYSLFIWGGEKRRAEAQRYHRTPMTSWIVWREPKKGRAEK